jgi:hypothetical protein
LVRSPEAWPPKQQAAFFPSHWFAAETQESFALRAYLGWVGSPLIVFRGEGCAQPEPRLLCLALDVDTKY